MLPPSPAPNPAPKSSAKPDGLLFVVRRAEDMVGRTGGVVLTPGIPDGVELARGEALRLRRPDGTALIVVTGGRSIPPRDEPHQGVRSYPVQVRATVVAQDVPRGTQVWRMDAAG